MQSWYPRLDQATKRSVIQLLKKALPDNVSFEGVIEDEEFIYAFDGVPMPFPALSDGYKAFIGWVTDLIGHMVSVSQGQSLTDLSGIVLIDEIDLHLHPSWQRDVIARLSRAFPNFQFVMTSHSPLVAASVQSANVIVTGTGPDGLPTLERMHETLYGRSVEAVLMSPYFGLDSARPYEARRATQALAAIVEETPGGDINAAEDFLNQLANPIEGLIKGTSGSRNRS